MTDRFVIMKTCVNCKKQFKIYAAEHIPSRRDCNECHDKRSADLFRMTVNPSKIKMRSKL